MVVPGAAASSSVNPPSAVSRSTRSTGLCSALRTEALRKRGAIDRPTQVQAIAASVWESAKHGAVVSLVLSVVLLVFPWLGVPLALVGFVGLGKASVDLLHALLGWPG